MSEVLRGGRLFDEPERAVDIVIDGTQIRQVTDVGAADGDSVTDIDGLLLMPGVIDAHVHPIHDETFATVGTTAAFGGVTTICNQLYPEPGEPFAAAVDRMARIGEHGTADFGAHIRWDPSRSAADVLDGARAGALSIKVFLAHPDKTIQAPLGSLVDAMAAARAAGIMTLIHAEVGGIVDRLLELGFAQRENLADVHAWRATANEAAAIQAAGVVSRAVGAPLYVVHLSCRDAVDAVAHERERNTEIYAETCPHYLFLNQDSGPQGGQGLVLPPLRTQADQAAVRAALLDGLIDTVGTDHCGHGPSAKPARIADAKAGLPGLEAMVPLMVDAAIGSYAWLPRRRVLDVLCEGPARVFRIPRKGRLLPDFDADIVAIDPESVTTIEAARLHDAAGYSPYEGRQLRGVIRRVWRRGQLVVEDGHATAAGGGRLVRRAAGRS